MTPPGAASSQDPTLRDTRGNLESGPLPPAASDRPASERFGKFVRTERLGAGGMGEVWKAWDTELERWVALKFLKDEGEEEIALLRAEAKTAAGLQHPNIAAIYEVGSTGSRHWIAMQYVPGRTLRAFLRGKPRVLAALFRDAAAALHAAHLAGVVHRDLKPENLMVAVRPGSVELHLYVMDFGLARPMGRPGDSSSYIVGTPAYMAPEQARGDRVDARSDVWSLGASLYELLTGSKPFEGKSPLEILRGVQDRDPRPPRRLVPRLPVELETIVLACLEKDPARRYATAKDLSEDLRRWLDDEPIAARPPGALQRAARLFRRHRVAAAIAAVLLLAAGLLALQARRSSSVVAEVERRRDESESRLKRLAPLWAQVQERKLDLRQLRAPLPAARKGLEEAVARIDEFVRENPELPQGWYLRGLGRFYQGRIGEAREDAERSLRVRPGFGPGRHLLALVRFERIRELSYGTPLTQDDRRRRIEGLLLEAEKDHSTAPDPTDWGLPSTRDDEVLRDLVEIWYLAVIRKETPRAHALLDAKVKQRRAEEYAEAYATVFTDPGQREAWYSKAVEWAPGYAPGWHGRASARLLLGKWPGALDDLDHAIEVDPSLFWAHYDRGNCLMKLDRPREAIESFSEAIRLRPEQVEALTNRGICRWTSGDDDGALADWERVLKLHPSHDGAYCNRGQARQKKGDTRGAMADYDEAIRLNPANLSARHCRGELRRVTGDPTGALADLEVVLHAQPQHLYALYGRGAARKDLGDLAGAEADWTRVLEIAPADWSYRALVTGLLAKLRRK